MAKGTTKGEGNGKGNGKVPMFTLDEMTKISPEQVKNALDTFEKIKNGAFSDALGYAGGGGFPFNQGVPGTAPVEQANTLFKNLRYYLVSNFRQLLNQCYVEIGLIQTIVDVPVDDGLRGGVKIKSKQLDEDQIEELQASLDRDDDINTAGQAAKWNRLFGGAGLVIVTDQDPESELNVKAITKDTPLQFKAVDMWELFWDQQNVEGGLNLEGEQTDFEFYSYYSMNLHKSRVMPLKGMIAPSFIRPRLRGWGFSVVEALVRSINQYLKATELGFEVLDEFKLDVYKIKNLVNTLISPNGAQKVKERVALANWQKNYQNAVVMDSEDDFDHKQLSFAGLGDAMDGIRMQVAADMRMPRSKLFGESGGGLNSGNNEGDLKVYNSMVEGQVRNKIKYHLVRIVEIKCQKLFGFIPDDIKLEFHPLEVLNAEQEENVKTLKFNRLLQAKTTGEITTFEFREGCNRDNLLSISLDTAGDSLNPDDPDVQSLVDGTDEENDAELDGQGEEDADKGNEGADKPDAERPQLKKNDKVENSMGYEMAAYAVDTAGGKHAIQPGREPFLERLSKDPLWTEAMGYAREAFGRENKDFAYWWYRRQGGKAV